jgi:hypothetical protein
MATHLTTTTTWPERPDTAPPVHRASFTTTLRQAAAAPLAGDRVVLTGWDAEAGEDVQITLRLSVEDLHQLAEDFAKIAGRELTQ